MPRIAVLLIVFVLAAAAAAGARPAAAPPATVSATAFLVNGRGWGHGVGMSQYGALGFAQQGVGFEEILAHYYPGTTLGPAKVAAMRVLLVEAKPRVTIASAAPFEVQDASGEIYELQPRTLTLDNTLSVTVDGIPRVLPAPLVVRPGVGSPLKVGTSAYRGQLEVRLTGTRLSVLNTVGLEAYLQGVVPGEMPNAWPAEALKAQAVAARSYALASRVAGKPFDVYADVRSQVYGGVAIEKPSTTAAVRDTAGQVVQYEGKVAKTFFYSTSGGQTAAAADVFAQPTPYLVSVPDPYDTLSPYHTWGPVLVPAAKVANTLKIKGPVTDVLVPPAPARAKTVTVRTPTGDTVVQASVVRAALGLRSTWFRFGALSLQRPGTPVVYGGAAKLTGAVRGVAGVTLSSQLDGVWQPVRAVAPGKFSAIVKPTATTLYRLAPTSGPGLTMRVAVAPRVTFDGGAGTVRPLLPGAPTVLEELEGDVWTKVGETTVAEDGSFLFGVKLAAGVYRVRVPPTQGYVEGLSPELRLG
jgi:SpoIID/LytB domain protein